MSEKSSFKVFSSNNEFTLGTVQTEEIALMNKTNSESRGERNVLDALWTALEASSEYPIKQLWNLELDGIFTSKKKLSVKIQ